MTTHLESCRFETEGVCDCTQRHLDLIRSRTQALADCLREATEAGVPHALILPQLVLVFREAFGELPQGFALPGVR